MAAVVLLCAAAVGFGIGIGYAVFGSTSPATTSPRSTSPATTSPTTPEANAIAAKVDHGLVDVDTTLSYETASVAGTGMVVTPSGEVFTNNHVIDDETSLRVTDIGNGKTYTAKVVGYDVSADIAVLQVEGASHLRTVSFASALPRVGEAVVAVGNAQGKGGTPSAAPGTVTAMDKAITAQNELSGTTEHLRGMIETDAAIQEGDSGGPLVDTEGKVLGMDAAASSSFTFVHQSTGGFAIPISTVRAVASDIVHGVSSSAVHVGATAFLGVEVANAGTTGAIVVEVLSGTAAVTAGLAEGDTIVSVGGHAIRNPTTLSVVLAAEVPGERVAISWQDRFGASHTANVTLRSGPPS
ncbi:MAG TPA: trypsin-like peptidase domain-containing protein [Acidimicrobiales bacterium]|nr:trypsin-like peptidase domain-containing protein [Acidimicrobiales bacterium]